MIPGKRWFGAVAAFLRYQYWISRYDGLFAADRRAIAAHAASRADLPFLRVIVRIDAAAKRHVAAMVRGLERQLYGNWEAAFSFDPECSSALIGRVTRRLRGNPKIRIIQGGALDAFCDTDWLVLADGGAVLRPHALYLFALTAATDPGATLVYADEDRRGFAGLRRDPFFKPGYSPELARQVWYIGACTMIRRTRGTPVPAPASASWLRDVAEARAHGPAVRVPFVLYHDAGTNRPATAPVVPILPDDALPRVSIVIPTRDRLDLLKPCLDSIRMQSDYPAAKTEIIVADNRSTDRATLEYLTAKVEAGEIRLLRDERPFNFSAINNDAAAQATGDVLIFLNNDTQIVDPLWLRRLVSYATQDDVAVVGAKLIYPDGTVQHGGNILRPNGTTRHAHVGLRADDPGYRHLAALPHEVSGITGACFAVRASVFRAIGGFDPHLRVAFNDTLFCVEALWRGYRNIYIGGSPVAIHHESESRGRDDTPDKAATYWDEASYVRAKHPGLFADDPYYNPNLSLRDSYALAFPPRRVKPWQP